MATLEEKVYTLLSATPGVTALCPASRIKVPGDWQTLARPYIVHFPVAPDPIRTHDESGTLIRWASYQVSCFADSYSAARALTVAVRAAMQGVHDSVRYSWNGQDHQFENETKVHHIAIGFEVWE